MSWFEMYGFSRASLKGGGYGKGDFRTRVRRMMPARGVQRDTVLSRTCDYSPVVRGVYQNVRNICVTVRWRCAGGRGSSYCHPQRRMIVVPPRLASPLLAVA